jgi:lipopolysaccharide biosynthesis regulator YciM
MPAFDGSALLWLLLPLAAASGWWAARLDQRHRLARAGHGLPSAYFKGLNFLLNEQPDKAIEVFTKVLAVDSDTVEIHLALGNLFRRRGEVERAIRIHQNLIARPNLDKQQRAHALLELGQDYFKAGLFDRAENLFVELSESHLHSEQALRFLTQIYQQEKEWDRAIHTCRELGQVSGRRYDDVVAQLYCEQAEQVLAEGDVAAARGLIRQALGSDPRCVRASMLLGDIAARAGQPREALKAWMRIEEQDPHFLGEVAERMAESFRVLGDEAGLYDYLSTVLQKHGGVSLMLALAEATRRRDGVPAAETFVARWLHRQPSVQGLQYLIDLHLAETEPSARDDLTLLKGIIGVLAEQQQGYVCGQCGFRVRALHWQCPGCKRWNTVRPLPGGVID